MYVFESVLFAVLVSECRLRGVHHDIGAGGRKIEDPIRGLAVEFVKDLVCWLLGHRP